MTTDHLEIKLLLCFYLLDTAGNSLGNCQERRQSQIGLVLSAHWTERRGRTGQILFNLLPALGTRVFSVQVNLYHFDVNRQGQGISTADS